MSARNLAVLALFSAILLLVCGPGTPQEQDRPAPDVPPAVPAPEKPVEAEQAPVVQASIAVTLGELETLLQRKETPRVAVKTRFTTITGKAIRTDRSKLFIDVTAENVAVAGVLGVSRSQVTSINVLVPLSQAQLKAAREASSKYLADITKPAAAPPAVEKGDGDAVGAAQGPPKAPKRDLLELYPPSEGWGPARLAEIAQKRVVMGLGPFGKEREFLKEFDAWREAYLARREEQVRQMAAFEAAGQPPPEGFEVLPELEPVPSIEGTPPAANEGVESPDFDAVESPDFSAEQ